MALTAEIVTEVIRQKIGSNDDTLGPRIIAQIQNALKATARKVAASPDLRQLLISDKSVATIPISGGFVDLSTGYEDYEFLMEYFDRGFIYLSSAASGTWTVNDMTRMDEGTTISINGAIFTFRLPGAVVAGAGTAADNGTYTQRTFGDPPFEYTLLGEPSSPDSLAISYLALPDAIWVIWGSAATQDYQSNINFLLYPWLSASWGSFDGDDPAPTVTQRTFGAYEIELGESAADVAINMAAVLNASVDPLVSVATYSAVGNTVIGIYDTPGTIGNSFQMTPSSDGLVTISGPTFTGGASDTGLPLQPLKSPEQAPLTQYLANVFTYYYIQGDRLGVLPAETTGTVNFAVPVYPTNLAALSKLLNNDSQSREIESWFFDKLYELVVGQGNDFAQDGEK